MPTRTSRRVGRTQGRGQALVEFALIIPLVLLLMMSVFDFGRAIYALNAVGNAAREGVRTAIVNQNVSEIAQRAADQATALGIDPSGTGCWALGASIATGVCVRFDGPDGSVGTCPTVAVGCIAEVKVRWTFTALTPLIGNIIAPVHLESISKQPVEALCATPGACPIR